MAFLDRRGVRRVINPVAAANWLSLELIVQCHQINKEMMVSTTLRYTCDGQGRDCFSEKVCNVLRRGCDLR